jgi:hypothetical protein
MMFAANELKLQLRHDSFMEQLFLCPVRVELAPFAYFEYAFIGFAPEIGMEVRRRSIDALIRLHTWVNLAGFWL